MTRRLILILNLVTLTSLFGSDDAVRVSSGNRSGVFLLEKKNANPNANGNFRNGVANAIPIRFPERYGPAVPYTTDRPSRSPSFLNRAVPPVPAAPAAPAAGAVVARPKYQWTFWVTGLLEALKVDGKSDSERGREACWWLLAQLEPVPMFKYAAQEASEDLYRKKPVCTNYAALVQAIQYMGGAGKQYIWHPDPEMTAATATALEGPKGDFFTLNETTDAQRPGLEQFHKTIFDTCCQESSNAGDVAKKELYPKKPASHAAISAIRHEKGAFNLPEMDWTKRDASPSWIGSHMCSWIVGNFAGLSKLSDLRPYALKGGPPVVPPKQGDADATEEERREFVKSLVKAHCEPLCATFASRGYLMLSDVVNRDSIFNEDLPAARNPSGLLDADEGFGKKHSYDWRPSPELSQIEGQAIVSALRQLMKEAHPLKSKSKQRLKKLHQHVFETCCEKSEEAKTREQTCRVEQEKAEQKIYLHRIFHSGTKTKTGPGVVMLTTWTKKRLAPRSWGSWREKTRPSKPTPPRSIIKELMTGCAVDEENLLRKKAIASRENQLQKKTEIVNLCVVRRDTLQCTAI